MSREKILIRTSWVSTIGNAILSASKIIVGLFAGSLAVLGDGIDSIFDSDPFFFIRKIGADKIRKFVYVQITFIISKLFEQPVSQKRWQT